MNAYTSAVQCCARPCSQQAPRLLLACSLTRLLAYSTICLPSNLKARRHASSPACPPTHLPAVSAAEDPEKILDQAVADMQTDLIRLRQAAAEVGGGHQEEGRAKEKQGACFQGGGPVRSCIGWREEGWTGGKGVECPGPF